MSPKSISKEQLQTAVQSALRAWGDQNGSPFNLLESLLLVQAERQKISTNTPTTQRLATNNALLSAIERLQLQDNLGAEILNRRFMSQEAVLSVAHALNLSEDQVKRRQRTAINSLTHIIWEQEMTIREARINILQSQLMYPRYSQLFGVAHKQQTLLTHLLSTKMPWVIALVGIGGIGKSSLADAVMRQIIPHFAYQQVAWLRINSATKQADSQSSILLEEMLSKLTNAICPEAINAPVAQRNNQLRYKLKAEPHLIVIDNIETPFVTSLLAEMLNDLANPSKFLITTRVRPPVGVPVFSIVLEELSFNDAANLIHHHAQEIGQDELAQLDEADLRPIYSVAGGNPLALKLVTGLTAVLPLPQILKDLTKAQFSEIEQMYRHIYWQTWHSLSEPSQQLLELMPMVSNVGIKPAQLQEISQLSKAELWQAISELVNHSLLEVRGTMQERRYGIHQITDSFLRTEIIRWPEGSQQNYK